MKQAVDPYPCILLLQVDLQRSCEIKPRTDVLSLAEAEAVILRAVEESRTDVFLEEEEICHELPSMS